MTETDTYVELYKLHAELADRVSQRREGANRLHVSIAVGLVVFLGTLIRFSEDQTLDAIVILAVGICGVIVSASWYIVLRSYRQLNTEKFRVLHDMETQLPYQFFTMEWDPETVGTKSNRYWKLSVVEDHNAGAVRGVFSWHHYLFRSVVMRVPCASPRSGSLF